LVFVELVEQGREQIRVWHRESSVMSSA
jgi:hypothetical protein